VRLVGNNVNVINFTPAQQNKFFLLYRLSFILRQRLFPFNLNSNPNGRFVWKNDVVSEWPHTVDSQIRFLRERVQVEHFLKPRAHSHYFAGRPTGILNSNLALWDKCGMSVKFETASFVIDGTRYPRAFRINDGLDLQAGGDRVFESGISGSLGESRLRFQVVQGSNSNPRRDYTQNDQSPIGPKRIGPRWYLTRIFGLPFMLFGGWLRLYRRGRWSALSFVTFLLGGCLLFGPRLP
jgi:hypothetical protein